MTGLTASQMEIFLGLLWAKLRHTPAENAERTRLILERAKAWSRGESTGENLGVRDELVDDGIIYVRHDSESMTFLFHDEREPSVDFSIPDSAKELEGGCETEIIDCVRKHMTQYGIPWTFP